jgi:hypothetical protein
MTDDIEEAAADPFHVWIPRIEKNAAFDRAGASCTRRFNGLLRESVTQARVTALPVDCAVR